MDVRAAVVGAGVMGRWHARELARAGGRLVAVADPDAGAARALAGAHPAARAFTGLDELLAQARPDVVHVCTPPGTHVALAERALAAGAHVLVEKPVAPTAAQTERLLEVAASRGRLACPVHQYLFQPPLREPARLLERVGRVLALDFTACSAGGRGGDLAAVAAEILPHPLGVVPRLLPVDVAELGWQARSPRPGELHATTAAGGATVSIRVSMSGRPTCNELRILGDRGSAHVDFFHGFALVEPGAVSRPRKVARPFALAALTGWGAGTNLALRAVRREPAYPGLRALIAALYAFAQGRGEAPISPSETLAVARAREHLLAEAEDRRIPESEVAGASFVR